MRLSILLMVFIASPLTGLVHAANDFDLEAEELRKEVRSMNSIVDPVYNRTVHNYIKWYMEGPEGFTNSLMERSALYFPYIERELQLAGLPDDLKYLVVIESSVKPQIRSHMGAVGLWQLMVPTARYCGLTIDYYIDERMDPKRSTKAAIIYLKELYEQFNDWSLVMAAYNSGPGRLRRAIRLAGSDNYWEVSRYLPSETRKYVPKFIAAQYFFNKMYEDKLITAKVPNDFLFTTEVRLTQPTSLREVAKVTNLEMETLELLNSYWRRSHINNNNGAYTLRLPQRVVDLWLEYDDDKLKAYDRTDEEQSKSDDKLLYTAEQYYYELEYPVKSGEKLDEIAALFDLNPVLIRWWNRMQAFEKIKEGQQLKLILPHNDACIYIKDIIEDAEEIKSLRIPDIHEMERSNHPLKNRIIELVNHNPRKEEEWNPLIVPRGMSLAEFKNVRK